MTLTAPTTATYNTSPRERIHAFQIKNGSTLLGYIWFGEYEPENAAGVLAYDEAGADGEAAAAYWSDRLLAYHDKGVSASDAVLNLRENPPADAVGTIEFMPITVKNLSTLMERSTEVDVLEAIRDKRQQFIIENN